MGFNSRDLVSTLVACNISVSHSQGAYKCQLNRSRGASVEIWSTVVHIHAMATTESPNLLEEEGHVGE